MSRELWTNKQVEYLEEKWGVLNVKTISLNLNKTEIAVILKAKRLKLGGCYNSYNLTANEVANILNIDIHSVTDYWIAKCGLKGRKRALRNKPIYQINLSDLVLWLKDNQDKWDSRRVEIYVLGEEPEWLQDKRKKDIQIPIKRFKKWTKDEDKRAISLFKIGYRYKEIAEQLQRSKDSVARRLSRLDVWGTGEYVRNEL